MNAFTRLLDRFQGRGEAAVTVPPFDGALRPNQALEEAELVEEVAAPDNLFVHRGEVHFTTGAQVRALNSREILRSFNTTVTCAAAAADGRLAFGLEGGGLVMLDAGGTARTLAEVSGRALRCPTALAFQGDDLLIALGSDRHPPRDWKRDLMETGAFGIGTGSIWRIAANGTSTCLADALRFPYGLLPQADGGIVVAESWRHRLIRLAPANGSAPRGPSHEVVLSDVRGYPARIAAANGGGIWLAVFAPRSQLIEFVLREDGYRKRMLAEVAPDYWIAPSLRSGRSFLEPLQGGGVKQMGILKPWAPAKSYGLVLRLDANFEPVASFHSRADGSRHGITSVLEHDGRLLAASRGGDAIVAMPAGVAQ